MAALEALGLEHGQNAICDALQALVESLNRAIEDDLRQAENGTAVNCLAGLLFKHVEYRFEELALEELSLLSSALKFVHGIQRKQPHCVGDRLMELGRGVILDQLAERGRNLRDEWNQGVLEDLSRHGKHLDLLLHLWLLDMHIEVREAVQHHQHPVIFCHLSRHEFSELLRALQHGMALRELGEYLQEIFLELQQLLGLRGRDVDRQLRQSLSCLKLCPHCRGIFRCWSGDRLSAASSRISRSVRSVPRPC